MMSLRIDMPRQGHWWVFWIMLWLLLALSCYASTSRVERIRQFTALNGDVQFLPGAIVYQEEGGSVHLYRFEHGQFRDAGRIPDTLSRFTSHDGPYDYLDQLSIEAFEPALRDALPNGSNVKQVVDVMYGTEDVVMCAYTTSVHRKNQDDRLLFLSWYTKTGSPQHPLFRLDRKDEYDVGVAFGSAAHEDVPGVGRFIVVYWSQPTATGSLMGLDVFRLK